MIRICSQTIILRIRKVIAKLTLLLFLLMVSPSMYAIAMLEEERDSSARVVFMENRQRRRSRALERSYGLMESAFVYCGAEMQSS